MGKYLAEHSLLTNIGAILFFSSIIGLFISTFITDDLDIMVSILMFAILGGVLIMFGLLNEV